MLSWGQRQRLINSIYFSAQFFHLRVRVYVCGSECAGVCVRSQRQLRCRVFSFHLYGEISQLFVWVKRTVARSHMHIKTVLKLNVAYFHGLSEKEIEWNFRH